MGRVISTAIQFIDGFTKPSKEVINSMRSMGNEAIKAGKQIQSAGKTITSVGSTLTKAITVPIAGVATAAVKTAADFEAAMSEVGAISGASAQDLATLTAKAKEMGATTSFSASESAEAMKYMAMAGWKTADMTAGIAGIMNLAAAAGEDLGTTSDIVTDGLTAFGMSAKESGRFADVMAAASTNANTNVTMLGESFKYCAATAGAMGYNIEDISVALGVMANAGIKGSTAGTTLKNVIANMAKPTDAQAAVMQKLGISLTDSSGNMKSFAEVMNNLRTSFNGLSETEKASYATTLAGKESMSGLLTIVNASAADFDKLTEAINGSSGSAEAMAAKMLDNLKGQLTLLKSAVEGIAITIGDKLLPYLKKFVSWVQKAADYINNLSDAQVDSIMKWAAIAAAIPPIIMVFGKVVTMIGTVQRTFGTITKTIANFGGIIGTITSPAGIVIGVLAAIAVAAVLIIKNWDQVKAFLQNAGNWFKNAFEKAGFSVQGFKDKFTSIGNTVGSIAGKISSFVKNIAGIFKKEFAGSVGEGADAAGGAFETIVGGAVAAFDTIVTAVDKGLKAFNAILEFFGGAFTGNWDSAAQDFRNSIKNIFPPDIAAGIINVFNTLWKGKSVNMSTCEEYEVGVLTQIKDNFRVYDSLEEGVKGYFDFISASRYANLKGVTDPKTYIENIKADGYATSSQYVKNLLNLVSAYNLTQYDNITAQQGKKSVAEIAQEVIAGAWGNGTERKEKLEAAGYNYAEVQAIVNERAGNKTENKVDNKKSIAEIAQEVVAGKWGNGSERKQRLEAEGYDYAEVQATVNNIMGKSQPNKKNVAEIANEVISGKWGNGSERKEKLEAAGYNYAEVQAKVNEMLR